MPHVIAWDLETIPDISGFAAANDLFGKLPEEVRGAMGDKFPKHIYHEIIPRDYLHRRTDRTS